jgi:hypothetical protein
MRNRLLVRHFLWRFLDHDLISPHADRHVVLSIIAAALVALSLFVAVLIAAPYQFFPLMPPGMVSLRWLDERFFFTSASMVILALVAVAQWDALMLDPRDTAALGVLPIPRAMIVRAKFTAVAMLAVGVVVALNFGPTVFRFVAVPPYLGVTATGALALTWAHGATTLAAGAFGFLAVLGLREAMSAIVGQERFHRISAALQAGLIVTLVTALLLLPGIAGVAPAWLAPRDRTATAIPSLWFVGLHETLVGSVIDTLPRAQPDRLVVATSDIVRNPGESDRVFETRRRSERAERRRAAADRDAINLYRSLSAIYHELAWMGIAALLIVGAVTTAACLWNSRRLPMPVVRGTHKNGAPGRVWKWLATHVVTRTSLRQAGFFFTLQALWRQASHRVALASSVAVGLSLVLITTRGQVWAPGNEVSDVVSVPLVLLAGQWLLLGSVLGGFRHAVRIPAELRASTTFSLAWAGNLTQYISGVKRAGWIALVLPTLAGLCVWHGSVLGVRLAALHLGIGVAVATLLMEALFVRYQRVPFVSGYVPSGELKSRVPMFVTALLCLSFALAGVERFALTATPRYLGLVAIIVGFTAAVRVFDRLSVRSQFPLEPEESSPFQTQRLNLAS